ncbi:MAG TPA: BCCT family transporter [Aurantimonas sp.]
MGGGLAALQGAAIATGFPFAFLLLALCWSTMRGLHAERRQPFLEQAKTEAEAAE